VISLGLLALRLSLAAVLVGHGLHALFGIGAGPGIGPGGLSAVGEAFSHAGIEPGFLMAVIAAIIQLGGGLLIGTGYLTRYAAVAALGYLVVVAWKVHLMWGFFLNWGVDATRGHGVEFTIALAGGLVCLALTGAGDVSIDGMRTSRAQSRALGRARLRRS
jgi:putative oxidoreductase